jgi:hypothetical protein
MLTLQTDSCLLSPRARQPLAQDVTLSNGVSPRLSLALTLALAWTNAFNTSTLPNLRRRPNVASSFNGFVFVGVFSPRPQKPKNLPINHLCRPNPGPRASRRKIKKNTLNEETTFGRRRNLAAMCIAMKPTSVFASMFARAPIRALTTSTLPACTASNHAVPIKPPDKV